MFKPLKNVEIISKNGCMTIVKNSKFQIISVDGETWDSFRVAEDGESLRAIGHDRTFMEALLEVQSYT